MHDNCEERAIVVECLSEEAPLRVLRGGRTVLRAVYGDDFAEFDGYRGFQTVHAMCDNKHGCSGSDAHADHNLSSSLVSW
jgi:hypothetical protein